MKEREKGRDENENENVNDQVFFSLVSIFKILQIGTNKNSLENHMKIPCFLLLIIKNK
jgi:hypothetical protein